MIRIMFLIMLHLLAILVWEILFIILNAKYDVDYFHSCFELFEMDE